MCILLFILLFNSIGICADFDSFDNLVHIIKIKFTESGSDVSRGTGFVVGKNGKIVTNFHVISGLFKKGKISKDHKLFVKVGKKEYQAKVIKIDIMADLALIEIPHQFKSTVEISKDVIKKGTKIYALGFHDTEFLSINQGLFSSYLKDNANKLMALTIPLNSGMSGGPILNTSLQVVGVNVLKNGDRESAGYGINRDKLSTFLREAKTKDDSLEMILSKQINSTYGRVMASIEESSEHGVLNGWKTPDVEKFLHCSESNSNQNLDGDEDDKNENQIKVKNKTCSMDYRKVPLSAMGSNIRISFGIGNLKGSKNTKEMTYYNYINNTFRFRNYLNLFSNDNFSCKKSLFKNEHGVSFKVSICAFKYNEVPSYIKNDDFYKFTVKAVTNSSEMDDIVLRLQFSGETKLAKTIIKNILSNIYKSKEGREVAGEE